jgi:2-(1,2-epoxy-1,2-dihydrophenyl)acetyl-CoA isomerase
MAYEKILLEQRDGIAFLKLNDPGVLNAVSPQMIAELGTVMPEIAATGARCLLITGEGRGFCSGANVADVNRRRGGGEGSKGGSGDSLRTLYHPFLLALRDLDMPIVTAVNGAAAGVGMSLAMMGDIVCASKNAFFLQAFGRIGLVPDGGSTFMLPRMVGWGRALELSLLAERLPAEKACEWGIVNRLFDDPESLMSGAWELAGRLAKGPKSLALIRKAYWATWSNSYESQIDLEARLQNEAGRSSDFKEGVQAFLEKRDAKFTGK